LLYDEIWFLCRSLCPQNMRNLPYVRFLDEVHLLPDLRDIDVEVQARAIYDADPVRADRVQELHRHYDQILRAMRIDWDAGPDNHTHGLRIGDTERSANSLSLNCLLFDIEVLRRLDDDRVELVANTFGQRWIEEATPTLAQTDLAHVLILERIPNYLSPNGPYHPVIEEARANPYLKDFRTWLAQTFATTSTQDVADVKREVEAAIRETQETLFLGHLDEGRRYLSVGKALTGVAGDLIVPYVGTAATLVQNIREARSSRQLRWQGFLVAIGRL
jgi:hypothetical protein